METVRGQGDFNTASVASGMRNVGAGQGDYVQETRYKYVGSGPDPAQSEAQRDSRCGGPESCFGLVSPARTPSPTRHVMSHAGPGGGDYIQESAFKYVGKGAGDFVLPTEPQARGRSEMCGLPRVGLCVMLGVTAALAWTYVHHAETIQQHLARVTGAKPPASSSECLQDSIATALAGGELPFPARSFVIKLDHSSWERFGFVLTSERGALQVDEIEGGLLGHWNEDNPKEVVLNGDHIVSVNGISGDTPKMLKLFNQPKVVHLRVLRTRCEFADLHPATNTTTTTTTTRTQTPEPASTSKAARGQHEKGGWGCYAWTMPEKEMLHTWTADEADICTRDRGDGFEYRYTRGHDHETPGCGHCWCCRQESQVHEHLEQKHLLFRQGFEGYDGLVLKELRSDAVVNDKMGVMTLDTKDSGHRTQVLLRFDGIIGPGKTQIQPGSKVESALMTLNAVNPGGGLEARRVLIPWDTATSYEELDGNGMTPGVDSEEKVLAQTKHVATGLVSLDIQPAVQAWVDGGVNNGIALTPLSGDGVDFTAGKSATPPTLAVKVLQAADAHGSHHSHHTEHQQHHQHHHHEKPDTTRMVTTTTEKPEKQEEKEKQKQKTEEELTTTATTTPRPTTTATTTTKLQPTLAPGARGLRGEFYFGIPALERDWKVATKDRHPDLVRVVPDVDYADGSPRWDGIRTDTPFAARWLGKLFITLSGDYSFEVDSDDIASLTIDGEAMLGGQAAEVGLSPLLQLSNRVTSKKLLSGAHDIEITLLHLSEDSLMAMNCRYKGPDTHGSMKSLPEAVLRPAPHAGHEGQSAQQHLQRKFAEAGPQDFDARHGIVAVGTGIVLSVGLFVALLPTVSFAVAPLRGAWREREQRRQLRRYDTLAELVEGGGARRSSLVALSGAG